MPGIEISGRLRRLAIASAILLAYVAGSVIYCRWALTKRAACSQPCQELGLQVAVPGKHKDSPSIYRPLCDPLRLDLELYRPVARLNTRYALWYRLRLTNGSCYELSRLDAEDFIASWETSEMFNRKWGRSGLTIHIWGPDGSEVSPGRFNPTHRYLYTFYREAYHRLQHSAHLTPDWSFGLNPGESIESVPSVLDPVEEVPAVDLKTGVHGYGYSPVAAPKDAETPPTGFKILDGFVLSRPGKYRIQAAYEGDVDAQAIFPYSGREPDWVAWPMVALEKCGINLFPDPAPLISQTYRVRAASEVREFQVGP